jgi:hypothetical protein
MTKLENLHFEKSPIQINGCNMMQGNKKGKFTREDIKKGLQKISDDLHKSGKQARLGVSFHYKNCNKIAPTMLSNSGDPVTIWDPTYNIATQHIYEGDEIDEITVFVINNIDGKANAHHFLKKKKDIKKSDFF